MHQIALILSQIQNFQLGGWVKKEDNEDRFNRTKPPPEPKSDNCTEMACFLLEKSRGVPDKIPDEPYSNMRSLKIYKSINEKMGKS